jgi:hypothetical protein
VEGVQRQLRGRLTNRLRGQGTHHLTCMNLRLNVAEPDVAHQLIEQSLRETVHHDRLLRGEVVAQERVEGLVVGELLHEPSRELPSHAAGVRSVLVE